MKKVHSVIIDWGQGMQVIHGAYGTKQKAEDAWANADAFIDSVEVRNAMFVLDLSLRPRAYIRTLQVA